MKNIENEVINPFLVNIWFNLMAIKKVISVRIKVISAKILRPKSALAMKVRDLHGHFVVAAKSERGDVPGWVLVVLMTTGLVTGIWTVAQPRLSSILKNSLDNMNNIR